jgi:hypothetical protein
MSNYNPKRNQIMRIWIPNLEQWADSRKTDEAVAVAIHAIATTNRTAASIWEEPTPEETAAVIASLVPGETYYWGDYTIPAWGECLARESEGRVKCTF